MQSHPIVNKGSLAHTPCSLMPQNTERPRAQKNPNMMLQLVSGNCMTGRPGYRTMFNRSGSEGAFSFPGATWDRFRCTVEPSPSHIRCRLFCLDLFNLLQSQPSCLSILFLNLLQEDSPAKGDLVLPAKGVNTLKNKFYVGSSFLGETRFSLQTRTSDCDLSPDRSGPCHPKNKLSFMIFAPPRANCMPPSQEVFVKSKSMVPDANSRRKATRKRLTLKSLWFRSVIG